jgi:O-antigen ligase
MTLAQPLVRSAQTARSMLASRVTAASAVNPVVRAAFYLFVLSIPFEMPHRTIPVEIPTLTGAIFLLATVLNPSAAFRRIPGAVLWFVVYLWTFGLSIVVNAGEHREEAQNLFLLLLQLVLLLWTASNLLRDPRVRRGAVLAFAFACSVRAGLQLLGIGATARAVWTGGERVTALGQNANLSAIILSAGLVTLLSLKPRLLTWPLAVAVGVAILQTGSRGGLACAIAGVLALMMHGRTVRGRVRNALVGVAAAGLLVFGAFRSEMMRNRLEQAADGTLAGREQIYPALFAMISERPLLGWGAIENKYELAERINEQEKERRDAHNLVLELVSGTGVVGAVPFLLGLMLCIAAAWRARKGPLGVYPFAFLAAVLTGTISGTWIAAKVLWLALAFALAGAALVPPRRPCAD